MFSLRARENEFDLEDLKAGLQIARRLHKKVYLTANIFARNLKLKPFANQIDTFAELQPDALIMSDPGLISIVNNSFRLRCGCRRAQQNATRGSC